jgi:hypothetical protein
VKHQIYFLQRADGLIKIGTTTDFPSRLASLTTSHGMLAVLRIINGSVKRENELHHKFRRFNEYGEWFRPERGALQALIDKLEDGPELPIGRSEAATEWERGEAELMESARRKIDGMIKARMDRTRVKQPAALRALTEEYGFSPWFLWHARKRGSSVSAYGYQQISAAYLAEMQALALQIAAELAQHGDVEPEAEARALVAKIQARKARKVA